MSDKKPKWSVVTYNFNNYEKFYELPESVIDDDAEYIYITNDYTLKSKTWKVVYMNIDADPFYSVCYVRNHIFEIVDTDVVMLFDGSMRPIRSLHKFLECFNDGNYDYASIIHPTRQTVYDELVAWVQMRGMKPDNANKALNMMAANNYDVMNYKGLFQVNLMMMRRTDRVLAMQKDVMDVCCFLADEGKKAFRCDQVIYSFVINTHYQDLKVMPIGQYVCDTKKGMFFAWYQHNTDNVMDCTDVNNVEPFLFNHSVYLACII